MAESLQGHSYCVHFKCLTFKKHELLVLYSYILLLNCICSPLDEGSARCKGLYRHRTTQHINTRQHVLSSIRTRDPSNQAAADLRLRPRGQWDRFNEYTSNLNPYKN
jgi:hypothetical protein